MENEDELCVEIKSSVSTSWTKRNDEEKIQNSMEWKKTLVWT